MSDDDKAAHGGAGLMASKVAEVSVEAARRLKARRQGACQGDEEPDGLNASAGRQQGMMTV